MSLKANWWEASHQQTNDGPGPVRDVNLNSGDRLARCQAIARHQGAAVEPGTEYGKWRVAPLAGWSGRAVAPFRDDLTLEQLEMMLGLVATR